MQQGMRLTEGQPNIPSSNFSLTFLRVQLQNSILEYSCKTVSYAADKQLYFINDFTNYLTNCGLNIILRTYHVKLKLIGYN